MKTQFQDRNPFWGSVGGFIAVVLTVIAAMKHDLRWLLIVAWPFATGALWMALTSTKRPKLYTAICALVVGGVFLWMGLIWLTPGQNFMVDIGVGDDEGAWNRQIFYSHFKSQFSDDTISPVNLLSIAKVVNTSPYPIRIISWSARIRQNDGWFTSWEQATPIPTGDLVQSRPDPDKYTPNNMVRVKLFKPDLASLGSTQIEATRSAQGWFALEYPDHMVGEGTRQIELTVNSDIAGRAVAIMRVSKVPDPHDPSVMRVDGEYLGFPETLHLRNPRFLYYSDMQRHLQSMNTR
jgi:hypothetical protein